MSIKEKIFDLFEKKNIDFKHLTHPPTRTCEEGSHQRQIPLNCGGKTLLFKGSRQYYLFVLPAHKKIYSAKIRKITKSHKLRFATADELYNLTGLEKGALPPLGSPILDFPLYLDLTLLENSKIAFNPGLLTESVILPMEDYLKLVTPYYSHFTINY